MAYERNSTEGIRTWLTAEISTPGWNSSAIAKGLTEDVMTIIMENFEMFDNRVKQGILLSTMYMRKGDLLSLGDGLNKVIQTALTDKDDFVRTTANILKFYPDTQALDLNIDSWSNDFQLLLATIGTSIKSNGFNFHPLEDMLLQPAARTTPNYVSPTYTHCTSTNTRHFSLSTSPSDILSADARHARFKELVETEERSEQAEAQAAQVVAQKRAGAELQGKSKRVVSPTNNLSNNFPFPPPSSASAPTMARPFSSVPSASASSLYTKRPARPSPSAAAGGGLFIKQQKLSHRPGATRPASRVAAPHQVPRGLQRVQKTQMLDFDAATEIEQNTANAFKQAQDEIKAKADAKKAEALEKKMRIANDKRDREEAKKAQRIAAATAVAANAAAAAAAAAAANEASLPKSPTSAPTSPKSPKKSSDHVFAIPALPSNKTKTPPTEKLTTF